MRFNPKCPKCKEYVHSVYSRAYNTFRLIKEIYYCPVCDVILKVEFRKVKFKEDENRNKVEIKK